MSVSVIIPAAGKGERFGEKKQFLHYKNKSVLMYAISPFVFCDEINEVIIAVSKDDKKQVNDYLKVANFKKKVSIVEGGLLRQDSVKNAIKFSNKKNQIICIHDCVRPFISKSLIQKAIKKCILSDAVIVAVPSTDTLKETNLLFFCMLDSKYYFYLVERYLGLNSIQNLYFYYEFLKYLHNLTPEKLLKCYDSHHF